MKSWMQRLRQLVVTKGIAMMCGSAGAIDASVATDIPVLTSAVRLVFLRSLHLAGLRSFVTQSGLGHAYVCHIGDLAEFPFYHRQAYEHELGLAAAWVEGLDRPVIYDVGANTGFISGHLAQMLASSKPRIFAFEPVPSTFAKLTQSVQRLGLGDVITPVQIAVLDASGPVQISYADHKSLLAQVTPSGLNPRAGDKCVEAKGMSLDAFYAASGLAPHLIKIDVEGSETAVLRGAKELLSRPGRPALIFEYNLLTLGECGASVSELQALLSGYDLHYVDDMRGQALPVGAPVADLAGIDWICNLFAVPKEEAAKARWQAALAAVQSKRG